MRIFHQGFLSKFQSGTVFTSAGIDGRQKVKSHLLLLVGPGCLVKGVVSLLRIPLPKLYQSQIVQRLAVVRVWIVSRKPTNRLTEMLLASCNLRGAKAAHRTHC